MAKEMTPLEKAIEIAVQAHAGQKRRDGSPYILHPLRIMNRMATIDEKMAAILHDVVEDTEVTLDDLSAAGIPENVVEAVRLLTHEEGIGYEDYVIRLKDNPIARRVKLGDLEDNSYIRELSNDAPKSVDRVGRYVRAWQILSPAPGEP